MIYQRLMADPHISGYMFVQCICREGVPSIEATKCETKQSYVVCKGLRLQLATFAAMGDMHEWNKNNKRTKLYLSASTFLDIEVALLYTLHRYFFFPFCSSASLPAGRQKRSLRDWPRSFSKRPGPWAATKRMKATLGELVGSILQGWAVLYN